MAPRPWIAIGLCLWLAACEEEGVRAYRAPKPAAKSQASPANSRIAWEVPEGWQSVKSDQPMRIATFKPASGSPEITVTSFPGDSGGLLANINRWRGQVGLDPIEEAALPQTVQSFDSPGVRVAITDLTGKNGQEMLGAVITPGDGNTWFVKATGEPGVIAPLKSSFTGFARSFHLAAAPVGEPAATAPAPAPTGDDDIQGRLRAFAPPANWKHDPAASAMVAAAFEASTSDGPARITATKLLNDGGGPLANINRWREQLGLPPVQSLDQQPTTDLGGGHPTVDLVSADGAKGTLATIISAPGQTWFFKMTGSAKAVAAERAAYQKLVRSVGLGEHAP